MDIKIYWNLSVYVSTV